MVVGAAPVGDDSPVKAPGIPQDVLQQMGILVGIGAVDQVVAGHDGLGMALGDGNLEVGQVELPQGPLVHNRVGGHAAQLLVVGGKMLGAGGDAVFLDAADIGGGHLAGEVGVFREILKVASAQRAALGVQSGAQHHRHILCGGLGAQRTADLLAQGGVPAAGHGAGRGEAGGRFAGVLAQMVRRTGLLAQTVGAVRQPDLRDAVLRHGARLEGCRAGEQGAFLFQRQLLDYGFDIRHVTSSFADQKKATPGVCLQAEARRSLLQYSDKNPVNSFWGCSDRRPAVLGGNYLAAFPLSSDGGLRRHPR